MLKCLIQPWTSACVYTISIRQENRLQVLIWMCKFKSKWNCNLEQHSLRKKQCGKPYSQESHEQLWNERFVSFSNDSKLGSFINTSHRHFEDDFLPQPLSYSLLCRHKIIALPLKCVTSFLEIFHTILIII